MLSIEIKHLECLHSIWSGVWAAKCSMPQVKDEVQFRERHRFPSPAVFIYSPSLNPMKREPGMMIENEGFTKHSEEKQSVQWYRPGSSTQSSHFPSMDVGLAPRSYIQRRNWHDRVRSFSLRYRAPFFDLLLEWVSVGSPFSSSSSSGCVRNVSAASMRMSMRLSLPERKKGNPPREWGPLRRGRCLEYGASQDH